MCTSNGSIPSPLYSVCATRPALQSSPSLGHVLNFHNKAAALDGVDEDVTAREVRVAAPAARELGRATARLVVVVRVNVEEPNLLHALPRRVRRDRPHIDDPQAGAVVALVAEPVVHVLVVVDAGHR